MVKIAKMPVCTIILLRILFSLSKSPVLGSLGTTAVVEVVDTTTVGIYTITYNVNYKNILVIMTLIIIIKKT